VVEKYISGQEGYEKGLGRRERGEGRGSGVAMRKQELCRWL
jgi:hypothetical protein